MTRMLWLFVKSVSQLGCVSQDSDALVSQGGKSKEKPDAKSLDIQKYDSLSLRHVKLSIREKKGPSLGKNTSQSSSSAKSPRNEI